MMLVWFAMISTLFLFSCEQKQKEPAELQVLTGAACDKFFSAGQKQVVASLGKAELNNLRGSSCADQIDLLESFVETEKENKHATEGAEKAAREAARERNRQFHERGDECLSANEVEILRTLSSRNLALIDNLECEQRAATADVLGTYVPSMRNDQFQMLLESSLKR
jgi:hypothetical protein